MDWSGSIRLSRKDNYSSFKRNIKVPRSIPEDYDVEYGISPPPPLMDEQLPVVEMPCWVIALVISIPVGLVVAIFILLFVGEHS